MPSDFSRREPNLAAISAELSLLTRASLSPLSASKEEHRVSAGRQSLEMEIGGVTCYGQKKDRTEHLVSKPKKSGDSAP